MSTRGFIGGKTADGYWGVYHHSDSYPTGLGKTLQEWYKDGPFTSLAQTMDYLVNKHDGGWSSIVGSDPRKDPSGHTQEKYGTPEHNALRDTPICYCHSPSRQASGRSSMRFVNTGMGANDFSYLVDTENKTVEIQHWMRKSQNVVLNLDDEIDWKAIEETFYNSN
jgi:hypothetical protein